MAVFDQKVDPMLDLSLSLLRRQIPGPVHDVILYTCFVMNTALAVHVEVFPAGRVQRLPRLTFSL